MHTLKFKGDSKHDLDISNHDIDYTSLLNVGKTKKEVEAYEHTNIF